MIFDDLLKQGLDVVLVNDTPYLFSNMRIDRDSIPTGYVAYDVRDDDECSGEFGNIKEKVFVNHWGTIVGITPLPLDNGTYWCEGEDGMFIEHNVKSLNEFASVLREGVGNEVI